MYKLIDNQLTLFGKPIKEIGVLFDSDSDLDVLLKHGEYNEVFRYYGHLRSYLKENKSYDLLYNLKFMKLPKERYEELNRIIECSATTLLSKIYDEVSNDKLLN